MLTRKLLKCSVHASLVAAVAMAATSQGAHAQAELEPLPSAYAGHVYINLRTGERVVTPAGEPGATSRSVLEPVFINEDFASNGNYFFGVDTPTRSNHDLVCVGEIAYDTRVDAFKFAYATDIPPDNAPQTMGLNAVLWWFDCDDASFGSTFVPLFGMIVEDLNGTVVAPPSFSQWIYLVDLSGTGTEFEIGDSDGSYTGASGVPSTGCSTDDDDLANFGWSYQFNQNQAGPPGTIGPTFVLPENPEATGVADRFVLYSNPTGGVRENRVGSFWLGGWPFAPYASSFTGLYANAGPGCSVANYNSDAEVDILDFLDFLDDFGDCENQPAPCGTVSDADLTGDTIVDILDFLEFFEYFGVCS